MDRRDRRGEGGGRSTLLASIAAVATRRPKLIVVVWVIVMATLALLGRHLEDKVSAGQVYVAGAAAERAHDISVREFGREDALVVMLRGPRAALDRQGTALVRKLQALPQTLVLSPWSARGSIHGLRPSPEVAALLVSVGEAEGDSADLVPRVSELIEDGVTSPVRASVAGGPAVVSSLRDTVAKASAFGERLAIPVLLVILLIVCRSLPAAAMPVVIGGFVAGASRGILNLLAGVVPIDSIGIGVASMIGLALGVDYSLLIVARFREELGDDDPRDAVRTTVLKTGRAIVPAGCGLILALMAALLLIPGSYVSSVVLAAASATVLSVISALFLAPSALALLGHRVNRWALPRRREGGALVMVWSRRVSRRPALVLALLFVLMLCSVWAFTLRTNVGVASLLPTDDPGRQAQEKIAHVLGPGWVAPFEILVDAGDRPVTTPHRLRSLERFQRRVEGEPGVTAMAGFATLENATDALASARGRIAHQERGAERLSDGLGRLEGASADGADGLVSAADGAGALSNASASASDGTGRLVSALGSSVAGSVRLSRGLGNASEGSGDLTAATRKTSTGADRIAAKVQEAQMQADEAVASGAPLRNALLSGEQTGSEAPLQDTRSRLAAAWEEMQGMTVGRDDPRFPALAAAIREATADVGGIDPETEEETRPTNLARSLEDSLGQFELALYLLQKQKDSQRQAREGVDKLADASGKLESGLERLLESSRKMRSGLARLSQSSEELPPGMRRLHGGASQLLAGLSRLESGADALAGHLADGASGSRRMTAALSRLHTATGKLGHQAFEEQSPGFFRSGYYYLAGLDGTPPERRNQVGFLVNIAQGGSAARMLVIPDAPAATDRSSETEARLVSDASRLARETGTEVVVGGLSPGLVELDSALRDQTPMARLILSLVTILILMLVTRSVALPVVAALLNLLTVSVTFGVLSLLFNGSLLGGPGFVDSSVIPATVVLTFGLAVDYEVFILARIREEYLRTGETDAAISNGLAKTAPVISGAAMIMVAVFLAFAISSLMFLRNLGVALAVGVLIDAYLVRFVVLPWVMRALGDRCWWMPRWLDRLLPGGRAPVREA